MRVDSQQLVSNAARVHVEVKMRHLLAGSLPRRVPDAEPIVGKSAVDCPRDSGNRDENRGRRALVRRPNISDMNARNDEHVSRMELTQI